MLGTAADRGAGAVGWEGVGADRADSLPAPVQPPSRNTTAAVAARAATVVTKLRALITPLSAQCKISEGAAHPTHGRQLARACLRWEGACSRVHPHARTGGRYQHDGGHSRADPRAVGRGRPRSRPDRVVADKGYPSKANRAWLRQRGIAATIPERDDQIAHGRKKRAARSTSATSSGCVTEAGTSSSGTSTSSTSGAASQCAQARLLATTAPAFASPLRSSGSPARLVSVLLKRRFLSALRDPGLRVQSRAPGWIDTEPALARQSP